MSKIGIILIFLMLFGVGLRQYAIGQQEQEASSMTEAKDIVPIDNPHNLTSFGYTKEFTPDHFAGIGSDTLYVVSTEGDSFVLYPRPHLVQCSVVHLSKEERQKLLRRYFFLETAVKKYAKEGVSAYRDFLLEKSAGDVVDVQILADDCVNIIFEDGESEEITFNTGPSDLVKSPINPLETWMKKFQSSLDNGMTVWFGTDHYTSYAASKDQKLVFRQAVEELKASKVLQDKTVTLFPFLQYEGVIFDASH